MKSFRTRLKVLNESNLSKEAQDLHDKILPLLKPMQIINDYLDHGDQVDDDTYHERHKSIKLLENMLGDPELKQEHFNEAMLHLVPRRHDSVDPNFTRPLESVHTFRMVFPVFNGLPIGRINNFLEFLPKDFITENMDKEEIEKLHNNILRNSRHTPETLKKSMFHAYFHRVEPFRIREAIANQRDSAYSDFHGSTRLDDSSISEAMRIINDHNEIESMFNKPPYMTSADRRKINDVYDDY